MNILSLKCFVFFDFTFILNKVQNKCFVICLWDFFLTSIKNIEKLKKKLLFNNVFNFQFIEKLRDIFEHLFYKKKITNIKKKIRLNISIVLIIIILICLIFS